MEQTRPPPERPGFSLVRSAVERRADKRDRAVNVSLDAQRRAWAPVTQREPAPSHDACQHLAFAGASLAWSSARKCRCRAEQSARTAISATVHGRSAHFLASRAAPVLAGPGRKGAVNADNFVVATEERIDSTKLRTGTGSSRANPARPCKAAQ